MKTIINASKFKHMTIILTGATGTLGSQVLYELLQQSQTEKLFLLIRKKGALTAQERLKSILDNSAAPQYIQKNKEALKEKIVALEPKDFMKPSNYLNPDSINYFIHSAGCVNLSTAEIHKDLLFDQNFELTKHLFNSFKPFLHKFTYISTAFSIGDIGGVIDNNYHNKTAKYRNHYEASKHAAEKFLLEQQERSGINIQVLRPSVLGGNIYQHAKHFISKYMVYYLVGRYFYNNPLARDHSVRLAINSASGLNIVPVDYAAKVIAKVYTQTIEQLNIVQKTSTNVQAGMKRIIEAVGFTNYRFINTQDANFIVDAKNKLEDMYYNTIGLHLNKYITSQPYEFDTRLLESIVPMPEYDVEDYLAETIKYAKSRNFKGAW